MNTLTIMSTLLLILLLSTTFFASSVNLFFSNDELNEMGVRLEPADSSCK